MAPHTHISYHTIDILDDAILDSRWKIYGILLPEWNAHLDQNIYHVINVYHTLRIESFFKKKKSRNVSYACWFVTLYFHASCDIRGDLTSFIAAFTAFYTTVKHIFCMSLSFHFPFSPRMFLLFKSFYDFCILVIVLLVIFMSINIFDSSVNFSKLYYWWSIYNETLIDFIIDESHCESSKNRNTLLGRL